MATARPDIPSPEALRALTENHRDFLAFIERRVGDRQLAEDILQDAFVRAIAHTNDLRRDESLVPWFYRVLRNAITDHYRRRGARDRALASYATDAPDSVAPDTEWKDLACRCVMRLAAALKPEYADALTRIEVDGIAVAEYARERGITAANAGVRVFRARAALRKQVQLSCRTCATHGCLDCTCAA